MFELPPFGENSRRHLSINYLVNFSPSIHQKLRKFNYFQKKSFHKKDFRKFSLHCFLTHFFLNPDA